MSEISPKQFKENWDNGTKPFLLDVREPDEWATCNLADYGAVLIPMSQVPQRLDEIPRDTPIVCQCRSGGRSAKVQSFLLSNGYTDVTNLTGGILQWATDVDSSLPRY
jgi:sulfur-carrier protein adenylyltransferase/sulfurtransferase